SITKSRTVMDKRTVDKVIDAILSFFETLLPESWREKVRKSLFQKMFVATIITLSISVILSFIGSFLYNVHEMHRNLRIRCDRIAERVAHTITDPAWDLARDQMMTILDLENIDHDVAGIIYSDFKGDVGSFSIGSVDDNNYHMTSLPVWNDPDRRPDIYCVSTKMVRRESIAFGKVTVYMTDHFVLHNLIVSLIFRTIIDILMTIIIVLVILAFFKRRIIDPVRDINTMITRFQNRDFSARALISDPDEIGALAMSFNAMADTIQHHSENLEKLVDERTGQLFHAEKMASLSEFVASIAHDINTPVGICLTTVSFIADQTKRSMTEFSDGSMSRSDLEKHYATLGEALTLMQSNLEKTRDLVQSFKKLTSDRYIEERQKFNVLHYLNDIMITLRPKLRKTKHVVRIVCDDKLTIETYPGNFSQVIMNFVVNSLTHAFDGNNNGVISIEAKDDAGDFVLSYSDNGKGIPREYIERIFDPFFTTRRDKGGTGLGLSIAQKVVTKIMGGTIECTSTPGVETLFRIRIPKAVRTS
ncbi:MAG TPA: HAMP domain-containing sensor histidine kinase, partial [Spirochaetota bacterium]